MNVASAMDLENSKDKAIPVPGLVFDGWEISEMFSAGPVEGRTVTATATRGELVLTASGANSDVVRDTLGDMIRKHHLD